MQKYVTDILKMKKIFKSCIRNMAQRFVLIYIFSINKFKKLCKNQIQRFTSCSQGFASRCVIHRCIQLNRWICIIKVTDKRERIERWAVKLRRWKCALTCLPRALLPAVQGNMRVQIYISKSCLPLRRFFRHQNKRRLPEDEAWALPPGWDSALVEHLIWNF